MIFYEIKVKFASMTEDGIENTTETYVIAGLTCTDVENKLMEIIQPRLSGDYEVQSCKKVQFWDIITNAALNEFWFKAKAELITIEDFGTESRHAVNILVQGDTIRDALMFLEAKMQEVDCEIVSIAKSPIIEIIKAK